MMKIKGLIIVALGIVFLSSCSGGYTCPTYAKDTQNTNIGVTKDAPTNTEINS